MTNDKSPVPKEKGICHWSLINCHLSFMEGELLLENLLSER